MPGREHPRAGRGYGHGVGLSQVEQHELGPDDGAEHLTEQHEPLPPDGDRLKRQLLQPEVVQGLQRVDDARRVGIRSGDGRSPVDPHTLRSEQPTGRNAHLTGPIVNSTARFHVFFAAPGSATTSPFATLDVDQTNCCGPETITIAQQQAGIYRYYVNNFSQETPLSASNARVDVYFGNALVNQFFVPAQQGTYWTVFEISGTALTPINTVGTAIPAITLGGWRALGATGAHAGSTVDNSFDLFSATIAKPAKPNNR